MDRAQVFVLDGGLDRWVAEGRPVTVEPTKVAPCVFHADFDASHVVGLDEMRRIVDSGSAQIADARPAGRFYGTEPEPRPGVRSFGIAAVVDDFDAAREAMGGHLGEVRDAVQQGRRIATVRHRELGLGTPIALMSPRAPR